MSTLPLYSELLTDPPLDNSVPLCEGTVAEMEASYRFFKERHLQAIWLEQKYFKNLQTSEGLPIVVLSPGIWNGESGPDFLKAHLKIDQKELRGDIELHLNEESWYHHQHHRDEKYNQVILHIGFWQPKKKQPILTSQGKEIPCTYFENRLTIPEVRIVKLIDLDLYPYKHFVGSGMCANALFRSLPDSKIIDFFKKAAHWRLTQKRRFLQAKIDEPEEYLAGGIAMALGYKHNAEAFLQLFFRLKRQNYTEEQDFFAYALGICGFFDEKYRRKWSNSSAFLALADRFDSLSKSDNQLPITLSLDRTRPANHPIRRLAVLCKMITDKTFPALTMQIMKLWKDHRNVGSAKGWKNFQKLLFEIFPAYRDDYWEHHYTFEEKKLIKQMALVGDNLKQEILINIYLPLLQEDVEKRNDPYEKEAFLNFYDSLPAAKTKKSSYLTHRFFGDTQKGHLLQRAEIQQGAYQLHRDFCTHFEASCMGCPFVNRYRTTFGKF